MKILLASILLAVTFFTPARAFAETQKEEPFSIKGTLLRSDPATQTLHIKNEGGLELTFHTNEATQFTAANKEVETPGRAILFNDLLPNDSLEIEYSYNENYEKVAQAVRKTSNQP